jgi:hypothetical protein
MRPSCVVRPGSVWVLPGRSLTERRATRGAPCPNPDRSRDRKTASGGQSSPTFTYVRACQGNDERWRRLPACLAGPTHATSLHLSPACVHAPRSVAGRDGSHACAAGPPRTMQAPLHGPIINQWHGITRWLPSRASSGFCKFVDAQEEHRTHVPTLNSDGQRESVIKKPFANL